MPTSISEREKHELQSINYIAHRKMAPFFYPLHLPPASGGQNGFKSNQYCKIRPIKKYECKILKLEL